MSAYVNPFIELAPVLDVTPQINNCMITTTRRETNEATFKSFICLDHTYILFEVEQVECLGLNGQSHNALCF